MTDQELAELQDDWRFAIRRWLEVIVGVGPGAEYLALEGHVRELAPGRLEWTWPGRSPDEPVIYTGTPEELRERIRSKREDVRERLARDRATGR